METPFKQLSLAGRSRPRSAAKKRTNSLLPDFLDGLTAGIGEALAGHSIDDTRRLDEPVFENQWRQGHQFFQ